MDEKEYVITKQIAVRAASPEEAVSKVNEGRTIAISVNERPGQQQNIAARPMAR